MAAVSVDHRRKRKEIGTQQEMRQEVKVPECALCLYLYLYCIDNYKPTEKCRQLSDVLNIAYLGK